MQKIIYTDAITGNLCVIVPASKGDLERVLGPLTQGQYEAHVRGRSIPRDAINPRSVNDSDLPSSRDFRNAWCDVTNSSTVDIDCDKAKEIVLTQVRSKREELFKPLDQEFMLALEKGLDLTVISEKKQELRDITDTIKVLDTSGKLNDVRLLDQLSNLLLPG